MKDNAPPAKLAYSPAEAAKVLSISRSRVFEHLKAGTLRFVKDGSRTLIRREHIAAFLDGLEAAA